MKYTNGMAALLLAALAAGAQAHGNAGHAARHHAPVAKEQKPWGIAGAASAVRRTIDIAMTDTMRFTPERIEVREGETVRLRVQNNGQVLHELVIGTRADLDAHAEMMARHPGMEHDEPHMTHVNAGASGEIVWNFNRPGEFDFACLIPGHYQAGMVGKIKVIARKESKR
ncbi:cupredoxin family protein [Ramlibacter tataouinensis]|uniref:cupredoxin domain-containing protein n=1 Tax=Ramlibacter tataouinensis TaxID=94132 RepID=UPI0022F3CA4D|nr:cupredoxin family protein [Ramlibacter tataouinensis]WBY01341.1 cupredoxin family protein [Ramlibacter tataouinensis]